MELGTFGISQKPGIEHAELEVGSRVSGRAVQHLLLHLDRLLVSPTRAQQDAQIEQRPPGAWIELIGSPVRGLRVSGPPQLLERDAEGVPGAGGRRVALGGRACE